MSEHEFLKKVIDIIGYDVKYKFDIKYYYEQVSEVEYMTIDLRKIIFTTDFMGKYKEYFYSYYKDKYNQVGLNGKWSDLKLGLFNNLDNPVEYLYNKIINE